jgi:hypothetical protein
MAVEQDWTLGWMLRLGDVNRYLSTPPAPLAGAFRLLALAALTRATMSCRCSVACTNSLVNYCCEAWHGRESCIHPHALPSSSPRTLPQVELLPAPPQRYHPTPAPEVNEASSPLSGQSPPVSPRPLSRHALDTPPCPACWVVGGAVVGGGGRWICW